MSNIKMDGEMATYEVVEGAGMDVGLDAPNCQIDFDIYSADWNYASTSLDKAQATHLRDHLTTLIEQMGVDDAV